MSILFCLIYVGALVDNNAWKDGQNIKALDTVQLKIYE